MVKRFKIGKSAGKIVYYECIENQKKVISILVNNQVISVKVNITTLDYYKNEDYNVMVSKSIKVKFSEILKLYIIIYNKLQRLFRKEVASSEAI